MKAEEARRALIEIAAEHGETVFTGRREISSPAEVLYVDDDLVVLDRTPFRAESAGQVGDTGTILTETGEITVGDTCLGPPGLHLHDTVLHEIVLHEIVRLDGTVSAGQAATATVDGPRRDATRRSHTATHLLHAALRTVMGVDLDVQGSDAEPDRLRFDFAHGEALTAAQLRAVEEAVNAEILADPSCRQFETTVDEANQLGAIAFPGVEPGEFVQVVEAGTTCVAQCGGAHVETLGDIGAFRIVSEAPVGDRTRRVEAVTGPAAAGAV